MSDVPPPHESTGPSDLVRFVAVALAVVVVLVSLFLFIRARQSANSERNFEDCLSQQDRQSNAPGFRPQDYCQSPDQRG